MITIYGRVISKKNSRSFVHAGKSFFTAPSAAFRRFERDALKQLAGTPTYKGHVDVTYTFYQKGKLDFDIDNAITSINDVLQKAGIIDNDKNIVSITASKEGGYKDWRTDIEITNVA